jgi:type I restriction enzyme, S subunit
MRTKLLTTDLPPGWTVAELGHLMKESRIPVVKDDPSQRLTVKLHVGGVVQRQERDNDKIGATRYFIRHKGQFIYGKQNLYKGAIGIVPPELDGFQSTQDVPAFDLECVPTWLFYFLARRHVYESLERLAEGTGSKRIHPRTLLPELIMLPGRDEQCAIAEVLAGIDRVIDRTHKLVIKGKRINQGLIQDLLSRGIDEHGSIRSEKTNAFTPSPLGCAPAQWTINRLDDVAHKISVGLATSVTKYYRDAGVPIIRNQNIRRGYFDDSEMLFLDPAFAAKFPTKRVKRGDVLICRTGANVGDSCVVPDRYVGAHTFTTLIVSPKQSRLESSFLVRYLNSELGSREVRYILVGAGKNNLNAGQLMTFRLMLPDVAEQIRINSRLSISEEAIEREETFMEKLTSLRSGLMEDLLTGKVRVNQLIKQ